MRTEIEIKGKLFIIEELLRFPHGQNADQLRYLRKQRGILKWVLGEGGNIIVDEGAIRVAEERKKIEKELK